MLHPTKKENGEIDDVTCCEAFLHFIAIGWKVLFACVPPPHYIGGWACFFGSLIGMAFVTTLLAEVATLFGCVLGIKAGVTAITFIVFGTSVPDCFASRTAANKGRYADEAIGMITGSNSVNVFLGLGLPWIVATLYHYNKEVAPGATTS
jgi:solute carrier family 8 (sodium/calcium exchanger)